MQQNQYGVSILMLTLLICVTALIAQAAPPNHRVIIYDNRATEISAPAAAGSPNNSASAGSAVTAATANDLWVTLADLTRATQFVLKPQGVCRDQLCFPIPKARRAAFLSKQGAVTWFNLSEFARLLRQPVAYDSEAAIWFFGPRPEEQNGFVTSLMAPNFTLPDMNGKLHSLSDFRGKKVLLLTWASW